MTSTNLPASVAFDGATLTIHDRDGTPHLTARDLARAIGYSDDRAIHRIHRAHASEFTSSMEGVVELTTPGGKQQVRIFSPRGCHLIAMFARTPKAAAFRRWVLDVLEGLAVPRAATGFEVDPALARVRREFPFPDAAAERDHKSAQRTLGLLKCALQMYVDDPRARAHMTEYAEHLGQCLTRAWTEMSEATTLLHFAQTYLKRWKNGSTT